MIAERCDQRTRKALAFVRPFRAATRHYLFRTRKVHGDKADVSLKLIDLANLGRMPLQRQDKHIHRLIQYVVIDLHSLAMGDRILIF